MVIPQYTLSWDAYQKNICNGLGALQEKGEFVDMTLAADGHYVKVHKMVMCLVSPYIKDLISSANCAHPVIFLNNITYRTLCSILEYIYTGQVSVSKDYLGELIQAGKALYIKGLNDLVDGSSAKNDGDKLATLECVRDVSVQMHDYESTTYTEDNHIVEGSDIQIAENEVILCEEQDEIESDEAATTPTSTKHISVKKKTKNSAATCAQIQYTTSNQGNLQIVLNRYVYNIRYSYKNSNRRMWRCIFYPKQLRCPAYVITENNDIVKRCCTHNHPFDDNIIMRKVREGRVFSLLKDAQLQTEILKRTKLSKATPQKQDDTE